MHLFITYQIQKKYMINSNNNIKIGMSTRRLAKKKIKQLLKRKDI